MDAGSVADVTEEEVREEGAREVDCGVCWLGRGAWGEGSGRGVEGVGVPPVEEGGEGVGGGFGAEEEVRFRADEVVSQGVERPDEVVEFGVAGGVGGECGGPISGFFDELPKAGLFRGDQAH